MPQDEPPRIRKFNLDDMEKIIEIERLAFPKTAYPRDTLLAMSKILEETFVLLDTGEDIAGYIVFDMRGHVYSMAVKPVCRRQGYGKRLLMYALDRVKKRVWVEVRSKNHGAIAFYKSNGMKIIGRIPDYYKNDDALVMAMDGT